jgi:hypothetical protein
MPAGPSLSKKEQIAEIIRCGKDPVYFIKNYTRISHPVRGIIPFDTYDFQDRCVQEFEEHRLNIVLKSRQLGLSTICAAYATWYAIFYKAKNILVIATKLDTAINFIKKVKVILQSVPTWLLLANYEVNQRSVRFTNESVITAVPTSDDAGRSEALSLLIVDEAAFIANFETIWTGLYPTISTGGRVVVLSTPKGVGGQYWKLWTDAEAKLNDFNPIKLPWHVHPEHDQAWFDKETRGLGKREIAQEFLCDFNSSGDTYITPEDMEYLFSQIRDPKYEGLNGEAIARKVWVWDDPVPDVKYLIGADVARGDGQDYSAFHVINTSDCSVVAEYKDKIPPDKFAELLAMVGRKYNNALLCVENNTFGFATVTKLRDSGYPRLYYDTARRDVYDYKPLNNDEVPGFSTQAKTRIQILTKLEELIRNRSLKLRSKRLYAEMQGFEWQGLKAQARKDSNDDLVMSLAIAAWLTDAIFGTANQGTALLHHALLAATSVSKRDNQSIPGSVPTPGQLANPYLRGVNPYTVYRPVDPIAQPTRVANPYDLSWLMR